MSASALHEQMGKTDVKTAIAGLRNLRKSALGSGFLLLLLLFFGLHGSQPVLQSDREGYQWISRVVLVDPGFDFGQPKSDIAEQVCRDRLY